MATGDFNYYCEKCRQVYYNAHRCPTHGQMYPMKRYGDTASQVKKLHELEVEVEQLRSALNLAEKFGVLPSDMLQTIDALRADLAKAQAEVERLRNLVKRAQKALIGNVCDKESLLIDIDAETGLSVSIDAD